MSAEKIREVAALRNLGLMLFDPSLGFCDALPGMPAALGNRPSDPSDAMEKCLQSFWTPLFHGEWVSKPVRAFFRRVSLKIEESEPGERTVSPDSQAWMIRALAQCCQMWRDRAEAPWTGLVFACREMAFRMARFVMEHLRHESGWLAARRFDIFSDNQDWDAPVALHQGLWLEALADLNSICKDAEPGVTEQVTGWIQSHQRTLQEGLPKIISDPTPAATYARFLQGVTACLETNGENQEGLESTMWQLIGCILNAQEENGSWEGNLRTTTECVSAIARASQHDRAASYPDALSRALIWMDSMGDLGGIYPAPMPGMRVWEYRLDDVSSLLEATRRLSQLALFHPDDRLLASRLNRKGWKFAMGRHVKLPIALRYSGMWIAGFRYLRESKLWLRDLRIEPGSIARISLEALSSSKPRKVRRATAGKVQTDNPAAESVI